MTALCTISQVKAILGIQSGDTRLDARMTALIATVSAMAEKYCNQKFITATHANEVYDGDGGKYIQLRNFPITAVTKVLEIAYVGDTGTELDALDYQVDLSAGMIYVPAGTICRDGAYKVTYSSGLAADTDAFVAAYPDISGAIAAWVAQCFEGDNVSGARETAGNYNVTLISASLPNESITAALDKYRRYII